MAESRMLREESKFLRDKLRRLRAESRRDREHYAKRFLELGITVPAIS